LILAPRGEQARMLRALVERRVELDVSAIEVGVVARVGRALHPVDQLLDSIPRGVAVHRAPHRELLQRAAQAVELFDVVEREAANVDPARTARLNQALVDE